MSNTEHNGTLLADGLVFTPGIKEQTMVVIMLINNHQAVRQALHAALETQHDFQVTAEATTGLAGLERIEVSCRTSSLLVLTCLT